MPQKVIVCFYPYQFFAAYDQFRFSQYCRICHGLHNVGVSDFLRRSNQAMAVATNDQVDPSNFPGNQLIHSLSFMRKQDNDICLLLQLRDVAVAFLRAGTKLEPFHMLRITGLWSISVSQGQDSKFYTFFFYNNKRVSEDRLPCIFHTDIGCPHRELGELL